MDADAVVPKKERKKKKKIRNLPEGITAAEVEEALARRAQQLEVVEVSFFYGFYLTNQINAKEILSASVTLKTW